MQFGFLEIVDILENTKAANLAFKSILAGSPQKIIDDLKVVEAAGISEVILYFNDGLKPNTMAPGQMNRFMGEISPAFARAAPGMRAADEGLCGTARTLARGQGLLRRNRKVYESGDAIGPRVHPGFGTRGYVPRPTD